MNTLIIIAIIAIPIIIIGGAIYRKFRRSDYIEFQEVIEAAPKIERSPDGNLWLIPNHGITIKVHSKNEEMPPFDCDDFYIVSSDNSKSILVAELRNGGQLEIMIDGHIDRSSKQEISKFLTDSRACIISE